MLICPICKTQHNKKDLSVFESDCQFIKIDGVNQHLVRYQCPNCLVIFGPEDMLNLPTIKLVEAYQNLFRSGYREHDATNWEFDLFMKLNPTKDGVYINWGAGTSKTSERAKQNGFTLLNYDPGIPAGLGYLTLGEVSKIKVDGIISNNVIDHLQDPISDLLLMKSVLKEHGVMIHASDGFRYRIPYTKFHLFFILPKTVNCISDIINMKHDVLPSPDINMDIIRWTK